MAQASGTARDAAAIRRRYGRTLRIDRWWVEPWLVGIGLLAFIIYATVSGFSGDQFWDFEAGPYLSPFFEPLIRIDALPDWFSPAIWILWAPLTFRISCYYYRGAYYRAYFLSPPACAVNEPAKGYSGESRFPLVAQNLHRYAMYIALAFPPLLFIGAAQAFRFEGEWGIGLGSVILFANAFLLTMYTIGCHSLRHLVAGGLNRFSHRRVRRLRHHLWVLFTKANEHHRLWAWSSLIVVGLTDGYIRLVATGTITDLNTWSGF